MKTINNLIHHSSRDAYLNSKKLAQKSGKLLSKNKAVQKIVSKPNSIIENSKKITEKISLNEKLKTTKSEVKKAAKHLLKDGSAFLKSAIKSIKTPNIPLSILKNLPDLKIPKSEKVKGPDVVKKNDSSVFFITGLDLSIFENKNNGLKELAEHTEEAEHITWANEEKLLDIIKHLDKKKPLMLIGHSLGGDSAVSIANKINTPEYGFRQIELLVTLDSVGFNNDIIPSNVKLNENYISDQDYLFNDGPNIARNHQQSKVNNYLLNKLHTQIDSDEEVQANILKAIQKIREPISIQ